MTKRYEWINYRGETTVTDSDTAPDGFGVRVPVVLLDGVQREIATRYSRPSHARVVDAFGAPAGSRPGYAFANVSDDTRSEAYLTAKQRLTDAWRKPLAAVLDAAGPTELPSTAADASEAAYAAHDAWLRDAWRTA